MPLSVTLTTGDRVGKHELIRFVGKGGYGQVWLAKDHHIAREVAVKFLDESDATIDEHLREAKVGNRLTNSNLVKVHYADVVEHSGVKLACIAMDYHPRGSLINNLEEGNMINLHQVIKYGKDMLRGLGYLHELGMIHGDIKPSNVLVGTDGQAALTDYGVSCHSPSGTPVPYRGIYRPHVAPEVLLNGTIEAQTDIYQLGLTLFRLLNGIGMVKSKKAKLGEADYFELVKKGKVITPGDWLPIIPGKMKSLIMKSVAVDPRQRYQSALEMQRALEKLSYPGYWCMTSTGQWEGHTARHVYRFEYVVKPGGLHDFTALCKNRASGNETRMGNFSSKNLDKKDYSDIQQRFLQFVVTGKDKS